LKTRNSRKKKTTRKPRKPKTTPKTKRQRTPKIMGKEKPKDIKETNNNPNKIKNKK